MTGLPLVFSGVLTGTMQSNETAQIDLTKWPERETIDKSPDHQTIELEGLDGLLHILKVARRRYIIHTLHANGETTLRELAEERADIEHDNASTRKQRRGVYIGILQDHLPVLEQNDIIETNHNHTIRQGERFEAVHGILCAIENHAETSGLIGTEAADE